MNHTEKRIGRFTVTANEWRNYGKHRIYFELDSGGKACYDVLEEQFIKIKGRVGARFEHAIREAFELKDIGQFEEVEK